MIKGILTDCGIPSRRARFPKPPAGTYAVYFDDVTTEGADPVPVAGVLPCTYTHDVSVELYEPHPDDAAEAAIEAALKARGIAWHKEDRYWLQDVQRYQVVYTFSYTSKN